MCAVVGFLSNNRVGLYRTQHTHSLTHSTQQYRYYSRLSHPCVMPEVVVGAARGGNERSHRKTLKVSEYNGAENAFPF